MKVVIIEDEKPAAQKLAQMLKERQIYSRPWYLYLMDARFEAVN